MKIHNVEHSSAISSFLAFHHDRSQLVSLEAIFQTTAANEESSYRRRALKHLNVYHGREISPKNLDRPINSLSKIFLPWVMLLWVMTNGCKPGSCTILLHEAHGALEVHSICSMCIFV